jgi:1-acyl-sn-glycerol-3-phosphate acyltransferase
MSKYKVLRPIVKFINKIYTRPTFIGLDNIPKDGPYILAGNHIHLLDPAQLMSITKRPIHFLAKSTLFKFPKSLIFKNMGLIPVDRDGHDKEAYDKAVDYLKKGEIVAIYPEGTRERGRGLLPFKKGAVRMSYETNAKIIPFSITGRYRPFRKGPVIKFGKPYQSTKDIEASNDRLRNIVKDLLKK